MTLDLTTPPLMRKLLIGQLFENPAGPTYDSVRQVWSTKSKWKPESNMCWNLTWFQGYIISTDTSQNRFVLDDGTGRLTIEHSNNKDNQPNIYQPDQGDLVAVVGKLVRSESQTEDGPKENWHVVAKSITHLGRDSLTDEPSNQLPIQVAAELSWPLEVLDMSCSL